MRKIGLMFSALFLSAMLTASIGAMAAPYHQPTVAIPAALRPAPLSCVARCSPGGSGNTYCQGVFSCGAGSVCLSLEGGGGQCNSGNAGQK